MIEAIGEKVVRGERLTFDDGLALFRHPDVVAIGQLANRVRERMHGDRTYFNRNMRIEVTNVCVASCLFCSFAKLEEGAPGARTMRHEDAWRELEARMDDPPGEIHIVNGLHPSLPFSYYEELLAGFKRIKPDVHLKCFTAVEIHFFARHFGMSYEVVLDRLRAAGLDSLPGGGAEIFHPEVRSRIAHDKATAEEYLDVHRVAHGMGMRTNTTMLYGHVETFEHRVDHLLRLRALQDESGGQQAFIPLAFHPDGNGMRNLPAPTAMDALRTVAVSRLVLDNVPHVKAYWVSMTPEVAQIALRFGADDLDGTIVHETIYRAAGSRSPGAMTVAQLVRLIHEAGRIPVERDSLYRLVREHPRASVAEAALKVRDRNARKHLEVSS
ncbi:MAG: aminofutalosine synthase MqnE [Polyangiaceae bacterium]|jgi:aminodeoxyfutalosine synthase